MSNDPDRMEILHANGSKPIRLTEDGRIFIGDDEFLHPIAKDGITVERYRSGRNARHILTLSLFVGDVIMERPVSLRETRHCHADDCDNWMTSVQKTHEELDAAFEKCGWRGRWCRLHHGNNH